MELDVLDLIIEQLVDAGVDFETVDEIQTILEDRSFVRVINAPKKKSRFSRTTILKYLFAFLSIFIVSYFFLSRKSNLPVIVSVDSGTPKIQPSPFSSVFIGKAGIRAYLGYGDKLTDYDEYNDFIYELTKLSTPQEKIFILGLRDKDMELLIQMLPEIKTPFSLISMTTKDFPRKKDLPLHDNPMLRYWYTMNYHPTGNGLSKLRTFPLGIDFHTMHGKKAFGEPKTHWNVQNFNFLQIASEAKSWDKRSKLLYVTYYSNTHPTRQSASFLNIAKLKGAFKSSEKKPRWDMLREMAEAKFVLAPRGRGMSSIRFYEALAVGAIPIADELDSEPMNKLLRMLGGIVVKEWIEVTDQNLELWSDIIQKGQFERDLRTQYIGKAKREFLFTEYWMNCVKKGRDCVTEHFQKIQGV